MTTLELATRLAGMQEQEYAGAIYPEQHIREMIPEVLSGHTKAITKALRIRLNSEFDRIFKTELKEIADKYFIEMINEMGRRQGLDLQWFEEFHSDWLHCSADLIAAENGQLGALMEVYDKKEFDNLCKGIEYNKGIGTYEKNIEHDGPGDTGDSMAEGPRRDIIRPIAPDRQA